MTKDTSLQLIIEGALMASEGPISLQDIANLFDENKPSKNEIKQVIENLNKSYKNNSFEITLVASGYRLQVKHGYDKWLSKLNKQSSTRYSKAFLETLKLNKGLFPFSNVIMIMDIIFVIIFLLLLLAQAQAGRNQG